MQCTWSVLYSNRKQKKNTVFSLKYLKIIDIFNPIEIKKIKKDLWLYSTLIFFMLIFTQMERYMMVGWLVYGV